MLGVVEQDEDEEEGEDYEVYEEGIILSPNVFSGGG
jgi:hypothetical protein